MGDEKKPASDVELQVPTEGERKFKKPRLSESFECQGPAERKLRLQKQIAIPLVGNDFCAHAR